MWQALVSRKCVATFENMEATCITCGSIFEKKKGGYKRYTLLKICTAVTAQKVFPDLKGRNGFTCYSCVILLRKTVDGKKNHKGLFDLPGTPKSTNLKLCFIDKLCLTFSKSAPNTAIVKHVLCKGLNKIPERFR
jgi:hypothetical protein